MPRLDQRVPAVRGRILDRNGTPLAENRPSYDVNLYLEAVAEAGVRSVVGRTVGGTLAAVEADLPGEDFTRIYPWTAEHDDA